MRDGVESRGVHLFLGLERGCHHVPPTQNLDLGLLSSNLAWMVAAGVPVRLNEALASQL
jgi:hypothetical protein